MRCACSTRPARSAAGRRPGGHQRRRLEHGDAVSPDGEARDVPDEAEAPRREEIPADHGARAAVRVQPQVRRVRQDPAARGAAQAADVGRAGPRRRRGVRRADGLDRRRRAADAPEGARDHRRAAQAQEVRGAVHQRGVPAQAHRQVQAEQELRLDGPPGRRRRQARRGGRQGRRVRPGRRGDQAGQVQGLRGLHEHDGVQQRLAAGRDRHSRITSTSWASTGWRSPPATPTARPPTRTASSA